MKPKLVVAATPEEAWAALAARWRATALDAVGRRGFFAAALSGGRTPGGFYRFIARESLPWAATHLFQVDERLVPPESAERNARLIREELLDRLPEPPGGVHLVDAAGADAERAARAYEEELLDFFAPRAEGLPAFDLVVLGLGADGHTASLFPGAPALRERERLAVGVPADGGGRPRVTLTLTALNHARAAAFLVTGPEKRGILARVLSGAEPELPASRVRPREGAVAFFADRAAAGA